LPAGRQFSPGLFASRADRNRYGCLIWWSPGNYARVLTVGVTFHGGTLSTVGDFMKPLFVGVFLFASCGLALAQAVPLPRAKPQLSGAADPLLPQVLPLHDAQVWPSNCTLRLVEIARFTHQPTVNGPSQCGAGDLVRLEGIMSNSRLISVRPGVSHVLECSSARCESVW
jgi:hypothetical protein